LGEYRDSYGSNCEPNATAPRSARLGMRFRGSRAAARCTRRRATHGYCIDRSAVADSPARDPRLLYRPLRGRGLAGARPTAAMKNGRALTPALRPFLSRGYAAGVWGTIDRSAAADHPASREAKAVKRRCKGDGRRSALHPASAPFTWATGAIVICVRRQEVPGAMFAARRTFSQFPVDSPLPRGYSPPLARDPLFGSEVRRR